MTSDEQLYLRAARYQDQGGQFLTSHMRERGGELDEPFVGENLRMAEIAGAIAGVQLEKLPGLLGRLRANATRVAGAVGTLDGMVSRRVPDPAGAGGSSLTWFLPDPDTARRFTKALRAEGVPCAQMYGGKPVYANRRSSNGARRRSKGAPGTAPNTPAPSSTAWGCVPSPRSWSAGPASSRSVPPGRRTSAARSPKPSARSPLACSREGSALPPVGVRIP